MNGFLLINKDKGPTSHDIVFKARKILGTKKVGHTGTLDPLATGLMVVCVGNAAKAAEYMSDGDKAYIADMELGLVSDTLDNTGNITKLCEKSFTEDEITNAVMSFKGEITQLPPMYSAKKINGQKLYELARKGIEVEREPAIVNIKDIKILKINRNIVTFYVLCTKGTYIRSLIDDIGKKLSYGALMTDLTRVQSGIFNLDEHKAYTIQELSALENLETLLYPTDTAFILFEKLIVGPEIERLIKNGIVINLKRAGIELKAKGLIRVYNQSDEFFALMKVENDVYLKLHKTFFK